MSRIIGVTLLLIILVDSFYDHTALSAGIQVTKKHLRQCRCKVFPNGMKKCRNPLMPKKPEEITDLIRCLCSEKNQETMSRQVVQVQPESRVHEASQWSTGLCECHKDIGDCCFALCCLPVFTCKVTSAVGACPCLPLLDCIGCVPPASLAMRASVRERYGIQWREREIRQGVGVVGGQAGRSWSAAIGEEEVVGNVGFSGGGVGRGSLSILQSMS
ncbi:cornifelin homolog B-like protein [Lates japonicus]|uniref:Cornifelin homolog B-like protein n=1 Tax=Lates japonicus TaxID=270547 RepID=A0AAD3MFP7_LATJO|nr:cornifelin homolog B-like protein [Lates japonicus]